jgi:hypothetical protein
MIKQQPEAYLSNCLLDGEDYRMTPFLYTTNLHILMVIATYSHNVERIIHASNQRPLISNPVA